MNNTTEKEQSQVILKKLTVKKKQNEKIVDFYKSERNYNKARQIEECGNYIGVTTINGIDKIVKANFCRNRLCYICSWRRQSKFIAEMTAVLNNLQPLIDRRLIFVSLTMKNVSAENLNSAIDSLLYAYNKLLKRRKIRRSWIGIVRSLEITYKEKDDSYHPHIHMLVAVCKDYFKRDYYVTHSELIELWKECLGIDYKPNVDIRPIYGEKGKAELETIKYCLKPTKHYQALHTFDSVLKGRRLISITGIFAKMRAELKYADIKDNLIDNVDNTENKTYILYKFDSTGGVYRFYNQFTL